MGHPVPVMTDAHAEGLECFITVSKHKLIIHYTFISLQKGGVNLLAISA